MHCKCFASVHELINYYSKLAGSTPIVLYLWIVLKDGRFDVVEDAMKFRIKKIVVGKEEEEEEKKKRKYK